MKDRMNRAVAMLALCCLTAACSTPTSNEPGGVAAAYAAAGRYDEAGREIDIAMRAHPRDVNLRRQAAQIHQLEGNTSRAVGHLEVAIQLDPEDAQTWIHLGQLENARENVADAYVAYRRAAELAPNELDAVKGLALSADSLGFEDEAAQAYARWAELDGQQAPAETR